MDTSCCRLCMQEHIETLPLFGIHRNLQISDLIRRFIPELKLDETENLSKIICKNCFNILANADELRRSSIDNDRIQRAIIDDKKLVDVKVELVEDNEYFEPICNVFMTPDDDVSNKFDLKPTSIDLERFPEEFQESSKSHRKSKKRRTKESRQEPIDRRTCEICGKVFARRDYMLAHSTKQHNLTNKSFYQCALCPEEKSFKLRAKLEEHMMSLHLKIKISDKFKYFQCDKCQETFINENDLTSHKFYVHRRKSLSCDRCGREFKIKAKLQRHLMVEHLQIENSDNFKYFECQTCFTSYISFDELQTHSLFTHNKPAYKNDCQKFSSKKKEESQVQLNSISCEICFESFKRQTRLIDHMIKVHNSGLKCLKCNVHFSSKKDLTFHNHIHVDFVRKLSEDEIILKYECILCAFKCFQENELYQHLPCHVNDFALNTTGKLLVCNNCSTILKDYDSLRSHVGVHNEMVTHECMKCKRKFPYGDRLLRHLRKHKENERVKCTYENCNFVCGTKPQMKDHVKHKHLSEVVHLCPICGQSFGQSGSLRNHIINIHEKTNHIYQCTFCPKKFRIPAHLRNHQAVHTTEFSFKCEHPGCTKSFRAKRNLLLHQKFHDRSQLNYKYPCGFCERKFLTRDAVKRHTYSHTKVKPYACTFAGCDRAFSQSNDLNKHLRTHYQQEETYFCSYLNCKQSFRLLTELRYHEGLHYQNQDAASKEISFSKKFYKENNLGSF